MNIFNAGKSDGWLYLILEPAIALEFRMLFRKVYLHNLEGIPNDKPVLIAANHPTAFIDPLFFCVYFDPPVYNMTRGDIFRKPFFRWLLMQCNMFPVYRQRDGYDRRDRNDEVFEYCHRKLQSNAIVNIFVEGEHHMDKRVLKTLQKGIARVAFGTYERNPLPELQIIPVGCNYLKGDALREEAKVIVGDPIYIRDYWPRYQTNPGATIQQLCTDIRNALIPLCYHVEDKDDDILVDQLLTLIRNDNPGSMLPVVEHRADRFFEEKKVIARLNEMPKEDKDDLKKRSADYFEALETAGLNDEMLVRPGHGNWAWLILFIAGLIPFVIGFFLRLPISLLANHMMKTKAQKREYKTSIWLGVTTIGTVLYYAVLFLLGLALHQPWLMALSLLSPAISWFSIFWLERLRAWWNARRALRHPDRAKLLELRAAVSY